MPKKITGDELKITVKTAAILLLSMLMTNFPLFSTSNLNSFPMGAYFKEIYCRKYR